MKPKGGSKASSKLLYELVLATDASIQNPTDENINQWADLAFTKVWVDERRAAVLDEQGDFVQIAADSKQEFVQACDTYLAEPSADNEAKVENLWTAINAEKRDNVKPSKVIRFPQTPILRVAGLAVALIALLILVWGINSGIFSPSTPTVTPTLPIADVSPTPVSSSIPTSIPDPIPLTVLVSNSNPPFNFVNPNTGEVEGLDYDMVYEICARLNCFPTFVEASWEGTLQWATSGEDYMFADGIAITEERTEIVAFSIAYVQEFQTIVVRQDEDRFGNADELKSGDFKVAVQLETNGAIMANNYGTARKLFDNKLIYVFDSTTKTIEELTAGKVDAVMANNFTSLSRFGSLKRLDDRLEVRDIAFAFPPGSALVAPVNSAIADMRSDGTLVKIYQRWVTPLDTDAPAEKYLEGIVIRPGANDL